MKRGLIALIRDDIDEKSWQTFTNSNLQFPAFLDTNFAGCYRTYESIKITIRRKPPK